MERKVEIHRRLRFEYGRGTGCRAKKNGMETVADAKWHMADSLWRIDKTKEPYAIGHKQTVACRQSF